jgi:hypothetical protein
MDDLRKTGIEAVMDRLYAAVRVGDLAALPDLAMEVEAALAGFDASGDPALLERVQAQAARNASCLEAAGRGLRAARRRMEAIAAATGGMQIYDGRGHPKRIAIAQPALRQRL